MKSAKVIYLAGNAPFDENFIEETFDKTGLDPAWTNLSSSRKGWPKPQEAMLDLVRRGAKRVDLLAGDWNPESGIILTGRRVRLWG